MNIIERAAQRLVEKRQGQDPGTEANAHGAAAPNGIDPVAGSDRVGIQEAGIHSASLDSMGRSSQMHDSPSWVGPPEPSGRRGGGLDLVDDLIPDRRSFTAHTSGLGGGQGTRPDASAPVAGESLGAPFSVGFPSRVGVGSREDRPIIRITGFSPETILSPEGGRSRLAEEFRIIKRPLLQRSFEQRGEARRESNLIMVCSAVQGEGKTFVSMNLAISIAMELDSTVLLVDADVAKPGLSKQLGLDRCPGLIEYLTDEQTQLPELLTKTDIPKLTILPAGQRHKRSTELLASNRMQGFLEEVASRYSDRIVIFDSPPLLETTEAAVLASQIGQVVMVIASGSTSQVLVKEALAQFRSLDHVALVLNKFQDNLISGRLGGYGYGYGYGYGSYGEPERQR